jgi:hypothetical protein
MAKARVLTAGEHIGIYVKNSEVIFPLKKPAEAELQDLIAQRRELGIAISKKLRDHGIAAIDDDEETQTG